MGKGGLLKFVPNSVVLPWVKSQLNCTSISIHSYIKRHIKQIGLKEQIVLIPRVVTNGSRQLTHVLLPEFILPYCRYTTKTLPIALEEETPLDTFISIAKKEWDHITDIISSKRNRPYLYYLRYRASNFIKRYNELCSKLTLKSSCFACHLSLSLNRLKKYYLLSQKNLYINVLYYSNHIVSSFNST